MLNVESEIRAHLSECSHHPTPVVLVENNMCDCRDCCFLCSEAPTMIDTYTMLYRYNHEVLRNHLYPWAGVPRWAEGTEAQVQVAQDTYETPNLIPRYVGDEVDDENRKEDGEVIVTSGFRKLRVRQDDFGDC